MNPNLIFFVFAVLFFFFIVMFLRSYIRTSKAAKAESAVEAAQTAVPEYTQPK